MVVDTSIQRCLSIVRVTTVAVQRPVHAGVNHHNLEDRLRGKYTVHDIDCAWWSDKVTVQSTALPGVLHRGFGGPS